MATRFSGDEDELKKKLKSINQNGEWNTINSNQIQFRHKNGGVMNWYPATRSISFQGKPVGRHLLRQTVTQLLKASSVQEDFLEPAAAVKRKPLSVAGLKKAVLQAVEDGPEIVIGLVGPVGTDMDSVIAVLKDVFKIAGYAAFEIKISKQVIPKISDFSPGGANEASRINNLMAAGNKAREVSHDNGILAAGAASEIANLRELNKNVKRRAFIINSLKHPDEVHGLRTIYTGGFHLFGIHPEEAMRQSFLRRKGVDDQSIGSLVDRDQDEHLDHGQKVIDTFHMADFFVRLEDNTRKLERSIRRIFDILFGDPYKTPTFDEFAMFLAFASSLRSADLSRQVGAVVAKKDEILATGANDCPKYGGGLYWPTLNKDSGEVEDKEDGRDYKRGEDSNKSEQRKIMDDILEKASAFNIDPKKLEQALEESRITDLTEYGRVVHAEMDAILCCARNNVSTKGAHLFCTTFPCHNCAKHIIAAGIERVVFVEPYQKSKAIEFHTDSIGVGFKSDGKTVHFESFVGVGPRRFFDLFSVHLGRGYPLKRKDEDGQIIPWKLSPSSKVRIAMSSNSYLDLEKAARERFDTAARAIRS